MKFNTSLKGQKLVIIQSFQPHPEKSLLNILFAAETAKDLGAKKVILAAPYLAFLRQDKRFHPGEAITSKIMAKLLNHSIDKIITIDPHLHRYKSLNEIFSIPTKRLTANGAIADYIRRNFKNPVIIGPDEESYQWARKIAEKIKAEYTIFKKTRLSATEVKEKMVKEVTLKDKSVIIVDDMISTGNTIIKAAQKAKSSGAKNIAAIAVHGLFVEGISKLKKAGINRVITTNTIDNPTSKIDVASLIADGLKKL